MEDKDRAELCFPQLLNASCRKPNLDQTEVVLVYLRFFISVITVTLNLLVIVSVSHFRQLHTPSNLLLLSLAVSDFLFGLNSVLDTPHLTNCWFLGDLICCLYVYVISFVLGSSIGNMILISVERYVAICEPLHYPTRVTVMRVKMCVCMCWTCSIVYNGLILLDFFTEPGRYRSCYGRCLGGSDSISQMIDAVLSSVAPSSVIIILYMRVFLTAVSQARAIRSHVAAITLKKSGSVMTKKSELKAARTLGVVVIVFLLSFCPYCFLYFVPITVVGGLTKNFCLLLLYISPCLNPVIYALFYPWFRKAIRLIFSLRILQPGSHEDNML